MNSNPQSIGGFQRAVNSFKSTVPKSLSDQFARDNNGLSDLKDEIRSIQNEQGAGGSLRNMPRLSKFVEAMSQLGQVIEVFVNANDFVCFIWGPMKFLLGIAKTHLDTFDKLLGLYAQIGDAIPGLLEYKSTFETHPTLMTVLHDYYSDILRFHELALKVFTRSKLKELISSVWKTFESSFGPIFQSLKSRRELLESVKLSASLSDIQTVLNGINQIQQQQTTIIDEEANEKHRSRILRIRERLRAPDYFMDQEISTENRKGAQTGQWIIRHPMFQTWNDEKSCGHSVLYLNGIPGAGKTTLVSTIIERLLEPANDSRDVASHSVAYFYYKHGNVDKDTHNASLRAILEQLINQDSLLSQEFLSEISLQAECQLRSTKNLEALTLRALKQHQLCFLVLDGLDECAAGEAETIIQWFLSLINEKLDSNLVRLRIIVSGQRNGVLDRLLVSYPSISLESSQHVEDIREYCHRYCARIKDKFSISTATEENIVTMVMGAAKGMFLYARVVLENLLHQTRLSGLRRELQADIFPTGISFAYERVVTRVIHDASPAERDDAKRVLSLVIAAKRDLKWREIQSFFCIDPENGVVEYDDRILIDPKQLCGSLVDKHKLENSSSSMASCAIRIVHETACSYLVHKKIVQECLENARMLSFCARYMTSSPFQITPKSSVIASNAMNGYYSLLEYVIQHWYDHLKALAATSATDDDTSEDAMRQTKRFLAKYTQRNDLEKIELDGLDLQDLFAKVPEDDHDRTLFLDIENRVTWIRQEIENLSTDPDDQKCAMTDLYGLSSVYKCHKPWCFMFSQGFATFDDRAQHMKLHERPFACDIAGCFGSSLGFVSQGDLERHCSKHHSENLSEIQFPKRNAKSRRAPPDLLSAAKGGDVHYVRKYLDEGHDINRAKESYKTPLWYSAGRGDYEVCKLLLEGGADPCVPARWRSFLPASWGTCTPLQQAAAGGHLEVLELILNAHVRTETFADSGGWIALRDAVARRDITVVEILVSYCGKRRPPAQDRISAEGPLHRACRMADVELAKLLLQNGFQVDADYECIKACTTVGQDRPELANSMRKTLEMILSTGQPEITDTSVLFSLIAKDPIEVEMISMILSYSGTRLDRLQLLSLQSSPKVQGHENIISLVDSLLLRAKDDPQETREDDITNYLRLTREFAAKSNKDSSNANLLRGLNGASGVEQIMNF